MQGIHAAIEAARSGLSPADVEHPHLMLLSVPDEGALVRAASRLAEARIPFRMLSEPDMGGRVTALATGALRGADRRPFRRFKFMES